MKHVEITLVRPAFPPSQYDSTNACLLLRLLDVSSYFASVCVLLCTTKKQSYVEQLTALYSLVFLVANERTFLGYLRTSLALSMTAVIIAQLFKLQHAEHPDKTFGFYILGTPLACVCIVAAIIIALLGSYRFWRQQNAMLRGKVHAGGWEVNAVGLTVFMVIPLLCRLLWLELLRFILGYAYNICPDCGR